MPDRMTDGKAENGHVYREIKRRVISCEFEQGKPIGQAALAKDLGVSTTPVREVLTVLAAKGLLMKVPMIGFIPISPSKERIGGTYRVNQRLLNIALDAHEPAAPLPAQTEAAVRSLAEQLDRPEPGSPATIAKHTRELFSHVAELGETPVTVEAVDLASDSLFYVRTFECQLSPEIPVELLCICESMLTGQFGELKKAVDAYHDNRVAQLPELLELVRH